MLHHPAGQADRIAGRGDAADRAGIAIGAVHDRGVHLDPALIGEDRAAPGVEMGVVLEHAHRRLDRVDRAAAARQDLGAPLQRQIERGADRGVFLRAVAAALDNARAAMDDQPPRRPLLIGDGLGGGGCGAHQQGSQQQRQETHQLPLPSGPTP